MAKALPQDTELPPEGAAIPKKQVAVVIDDFGNGMKGTKEMLELPIPFTAAVMPFLPTTKSDAELAHKMGKPVFLHMPMEPRKGKRSWLGPGAITMDLSDEEVRQRIEAAIDDIPYVEGINNHMGSKVTASERMMRVILTVCKERGLVYLDSKTNDKSVAGKIAKELGVKYAENELFLDDVYTAKHVSGQVAKLRKKLKEKDDCIIIGHVGPPGPVTAEVLKQSIPELQKNVTFVPVTKLTKS
ncbi:divergent polysaccharide deacetylase family protein [Paenibacillus chartarius]|uniref:Divergent polysaccharide deacetylase family protein n=1 Tax=Paenibacillus chartarius TaxID=747481 RepID=A0ABV6DJ55_9BACL